MAAQDADRPRVRVAGLMLLHSRVVTVRHRMGDSTYHLLPGGGVRWGESLADALMREITEETGLSAELGALLFVNDTIDPDGARHVVNITFTATPIGGTLTHHPDDPRVEAVDLVGVDELPSLDLRPPIASHLQTALRGRQPRAAYLGPLFAQ